MNLQLSRAQSILLSVLAILLGTYVVLFILGIQETHDAKRVEDVQVSLQATVSRGMTALQLPPSQIHPLNIINAARGSFPKDTHLDQGFHLTIPSSKRSAQYAISEDGDVNITELTNFTRYHVENGRIIRNNRWIFPLP